MRYWGKKFPHAGYGGMFRKWLDDETMEAYGSLGNGSAMRVSPVAWKAQDLQECIRLAEQSAKVTHNHSEGIKAAVATAMAIWMARHKAPKAVIKNAIEERCGYNLDRTVDSIREAYGFTSRASESVPEAIICFLEGTSFEDVVRNAVSLGGDTDTQAAIAGSIAEAYYGIPEDIVKKAMKYIPEDFIPILKEFSKKYGN